MALVNRWGNEQNQRSAHTSSSRPLVNIDLEGIIEIDLRVLDFKNQDLSNGIPHWHLTLKIYVFLQLKIHKELHVCLTTYIVLAHDVIWPLIEILVCNCLNFQYKVKVRQVFEWNRWHPDLILLCWHLDHTAVLF